MESTNDNARMDACLLLAEAIEANRLLTATKAVRLIVPRRIELSEALAIAKVLLRGEKAS